MRSGLASLPMYDLPELRGFTDAWWAGLAQAFRREGVHGVPQCLSRSGPFGAEWRDSNLLFSQCCGMDYITQHRIWGRENLRLLATPIYAAADCQGPYYCSMVIVRTDDPAHSLADLRQRRAAINMPGSHSGYNALRAMIAPLVQKNRDRAFFSAVFNSGSHPSSVQAVQDKTADCAAIDCVSFALLQRCRPAATEGLRVLVRSPYAPSLPYVTHSATDADQTRRLQTGLQAALADSQLADIRGALLLQGAAYLAPEAYQPIADSAARAKEMGYPELI